jgi:hypothetical protein
MSITVFQIPDDGSPGKKRVMVHDMDAPENASTRLVDCTGMIEEVEINYESQVDTPIFTENGGVELDILGIVPVPNSVEIFVDGSRLHKNRVDRLSYNATYFQDKIYIVLTEDPENNNRLYLIKYKKQA